MIIVQKWAWKSRRKHYHQIMKWYSAQCISYHDFGKYKIGIWL